MKQKWVVIDIRVNDGKLEVQKKNEADGVVSDWEPVGGWGSLKLDIKEIKYAEGISSRLPRHRRGS